ncbi:MAG: hypothetical protein RIB45_05385 [Marivibrio sp.]|uniref:hypothetical protein n=1 Tax=Marivibrio sp. TaxID=2039719 RepID=UPI0032EEF421
MSQRRLKSTAATRRLVVGASLAAALALGACAPGAGFGGGGQDRAAAQGGTPIASQGGVGGQAPQAEMPPDMMSLPSLPVPPGAEVLLGDTVIIGDDETWTGQVVMTTSNYSLVQVVEFMRRQMPDYGWTETAIVRSKRTSITYVRDERFATVRIMPNQSGAEIDIVVAPLRNRSRG